VRVSEVPSHRQAHTKHRPKLQPAVDHDRPGERLDSVDEAGESGSGGGFGSADAVVADGQLQGVVDLMGGDVDTAGAPVGRRV
jgi:hypothetical protein